MHSSHAPLILVSQLTILRHDIYESPTIRGIVGMLSLDCMLTDTSSGRWRTRKLPLLEEGCYPSVPPFLIRVYALVNQLVLRSRAGVCYRGLIGPWSMWAHPHLAVALSTARPHMASSAGDKWQISSFARQKFSNPLTNGRAPSSPIASVPEGLRMDRHVSQAFVVLASATSLLNGSCVTN
jgi:hypothetical protein